MTVDFKTPRPCGRCKGEGVTHSTWQKENNLEGAEGTVCSSCKGAGEYPGVDLDKLVAGLFTTRGGKRFRASFNSRPAFGNVHVARVYYVWRMARFHGGADVTMPVTADLVVRSDPFKKDLDAIADEIAKRVFGTDLAAAYRWSNALGGDVKVPDGLPSSAYSGGPVVTSGEKPDFEQLELL